MTQGDSAYATVCLCIPLVSEEFPASAVDASSRSASVAMSPKGHDADEELCATKDRQS